MIVSGASPPTRPSAGLSTDYPTNLDRKTQVELGHRNLIIIEAAIIWFATIENNIEEVFLIT